MPKKHPNIQNKDSLHICPMKIIYFDHLPHTGHIIDVYIFTAERLNYKVRQILPIKSC